MKRIKLFFLISFFSLTISAQDTLTVLQYNLLYYGEITDWCDNTNNNINDKDNYLRTIIGYIKPDIFAVNEISKSPSIHLHLLDQVMNSNGIDYYKKATSLSANAYNIVNMLYYNSEKLVLHSHSIAQSYIRDIDVYKLYYLSDQLSFGDTSFITCVVAHLKSSSGVTNENKRHEMAQNTMDYLNNLNDEDNYLMMGDFNVYSASEPAYQEFINYSNPNLRFIDPVDMEGDWNNNSSYSDVHTQSTHADNNGCAASGGMDDRFDFILISQDILKGSKKIKYISDSYWAVGQDGNHFNQSLTDPPANISVPPDVLNALYHNSDHLPVTLKLLADDNLGVSSSVSEIELELVNPFHNELKINIHYKDKTEITIALFDLSGKVQITKDITLHSGRTQVNLPASKLEPGFYILRIKDGNKVLKSKKVIKY